MDTDLERTQQSHDDIEDEFANEMRAAARGAEQSRRNAKFATRRISTRQAREAAIALAPVDWTLLDTSDLDCGPDLTEYPDQESDLLGFCLAMDC